MHTSNGFAGLWLRSLYSLLTEAINQVRYLKPSLAMLLVFVGVKMLLIEVYTIPIDVSLGATVGVLAAPIIASFVVARREGRGTLPGVPRSRRTAQWQRFRVASLTEPIRARGGWGREKDARYGRFVRRMGTGLGWLLWGGRLAVALSAALCTFLLALATLGLATADAADALGDLWRYASGEDRGGARAEVVVGIIAAVDGYLIAAILLLVSLGLYELFVGRIEAAERSEVGPRLLLIGSVDDLKDRVSKLVVLVLAGEFLKGAPGLRYVRALDLLYLVAGVLLIGGALYLTGRGATSGSTRSPGEGPGPKSP